MGEWMEAKIEGITTHAVSDISPGVAVDDEVRHGPGGSASPVSGVSPLPDPLIGKWFDSDGKHVGTIEEAAVVWPNDVRSEAVQSIGGCLTIVVEGDLLLGTIKDNGDLEWRDGDTWTTG